MESEKIIWLMLASMSLGGILIILSALVTGYLVFRTKKEQHETLFPPAKRKSKGVINIDEFAGEVKNDDESGLPDIIKRQNERMAADLALQGLKGVKRG